MARPQKYFAEGENYTQRRRKSLKERGLCTYCGLVPVHYTLCKVCELKQQKSHKGWYTRKREAGLCVACGHGDAGDYAYCQPCRERRQGRRSKTHVDEVSNG